MWFPSQLATSDTAEHGDGRDGAAEVGAGLGRRRTFLSRAAGAVADRHGGDGQLSLAGGSVGGDRPDTKGLLKRAHVIAGEIRYVGKETDRKWEEGDEISILEFVATEYGRKGKVVASEDVKARISSIGINKCARESGFDHKNFIRKLVRVCLWNVIRYNEFVRWLENYKLQIIGSD
jgi:hypothetical protein